MATALALLALAFCVAVAGCSLPGKNSAAVPIKTAPPTPSSAEQGQLAQAVLSNLWNLGVQNVHTTYDPRDASATVTITLGGNLPGTLAEVAAAQELTKSFCLMALQALWTSGVGLSQAKVMVQGPAQEEYGDTLIQPYGVVTMDAREAHSIDWTQVTADAAWSTYDHEFLRPEFVLND